MIFQGKELKAEARGLLIGNYGTVIGAFLLTQLLTLVAGNIFTQTASNNLALVISAVSSLILSLLSAILDAGFIYMYLKIARKNRASLGDIFHWFTAYPDKVILVALALLGINLVLLTLLAAAVILVFHAFGFNAVQVMEQFLKHLAMFLRTWRISDLLIPDLPRTAVTAVLLVAAAWTVLALAVNLRYYLVYHLLADDPDKSPAAVLRQSRSLMAGSRLRLTALFISFAGIFLLGFLSFGLGFLWVIPYIRMTGTVFYLKRIGETYS